MKIANHMTARKKVRAMSVVNMDSKDERVQVRKAAKSKVPKATLSPAEGVVSS
jgi:hypothetical protein